MLVLTRKVGQRIRIGDSIVLSVLRVKGAGVRIGIEAPRGLSIRREDKDASQPQPRSIRRSPRKPPPPA